MALADVTKTYVDLLTNGKYATRTADATEFDALKDMYTIYLNASCVPDKKYTHGLALLVAHHYALDDTQVPDAGSSDTFTGALTSEREGDISMGYAGPPSTNSIDGWKSHLVQTKYGMEFLYLMKTFKCTPRVV